MKRFNVSTVLLLLAVLLLAASFFKPTLTLNTASYRYVYVFDISQSMNVADVGLKDENVTAADITRMDLVKQAAIDSLSTLPCGTEVGIGLFTGHRAFLLMNPVENCKNIHDISNTINMIDWRSTWEAKSEVAKGLYKSIRLMKRIGDKTRVVFFTDGHEAPPVNPNQLPRFPGKLGEIKGTIVGVGGDKLVPIPKLTRDGKQTGVWKREDVVHVDVYTQDKYKREGRKLPVGFEHMSSLKGEYLKSLAEKTGLAYFRLKQPAELAEQLQNKALSVSKPKATDVCWLFALLALLFFIAHYVVDVRK